jgi:membrane fusion protein, multidrug efflux system
MKPVYKRALWIFGILAVLVALALPKLPSSAQDSPETTRRSGGNGAGSAIAVEVFVATEERVEEAVRTTGTLRANEEVELVAESSGRITELLFDEGTPVAQGELLVKINDAELQAQRRSALGRLQLAETGEARREELLRVGGVSQEEYDQIRNEVSVLRAELELIAAQIARTEIRAPFSGIIGLRAVSPGSYLSPQAAVATLRQTDPIKLEFDVPERFASLVSVGDRVTFITDGSDREYVAEIYAVEAGIDLSTRSLRLRARSANPDRRLRPGEFAQVRLTLAEVEGAVMVPSTALLSEGGRNAVFLAKGGRAEQRPVQIGLRTSDRVQVVSGIAPGDTVITRGLQLLRSGSAVRPEIR